MAILRRDRRFLWLGASLEQVMAVHTDRANFIWQIALLKDRRSALIPAAVTGKLKL